jgi:hypothetical protein
MRKSKNPIETGEAKDAAPTLQEILAGYKRFNAWESAEQAKQLSQLSVAESLAQFFQLCALARTLAPDAGHIFLEQDKAHWIALQQKRQQAAKVMGYARAAHRIARSLYGKMTGELENNRCYFCGGNLVPGLGPRQIS